MQSKQYIALNCLFIVSSTCMYVMRCSIGSRVEAFWLNVNISKDKTRYTAGGSVCRPVQNGNSTARPRRRRHAANAPHSVHVNAAHPAYARCRTRARSVVRDRRDRARGLALL